MPCVNHPEVVTGLDSCTACGKSFCIDCLVGRKAGWFCSTCDTEASPKPAPGHPPAPSSAGPTAAKPPMALPPARPKPSAAKVCTNHPEVLEGLNACTRCDRTFCPDCLVELKGSRFCAGCKSDAVKDMQSGVNASGLPLAGIGPRFCAHLIDMVVTYAVMMVGFFAMGAIMVLAKPDPNSAVAPILGCGIYVIFFAAIFGYHGVMLQKKGQTLGKMAMKIKVVTPEGGPITPGQAWIRVLVWFMLQSCFITYIPAFFNPDKATIHDMAARTRVVKIG